MLVISMHRIETKGFGESILLSPTNRKDIDHNPTRWWNTRLQVRHEIKEGVPGSERGEIQTIRLPGNSKRSKKKKKKKACKLINEKADCFLVCESKGASSGKSKSSLLSQIKDNIT
jgi:hypothetical protein